MSRKSEHPAVAGSNPNAVPHPADPAHATTKGTHVPPPPAASKGKPGGFARAVKPVPLPGKSRGRG